MARVRITDYGHSTAVRGYMTGARGAGACEDAPVWALSQELGRHKVIHNSFTTAIDVANVLSTDAPAAGNITLIRSAINAGAGTSVISSSLGHHTGLPVGRFVGGVGATTGSQFVQASSLNLGATVGLDAGVGATLAGVGARTYDPSLILTFCTEFSMVDTGPNNGNAAFGLLNAVVPVLTSAGAVATGGAQSGFFFRIPVSPGVNGVSGPIECVWVSGGVVRATTITAKTYAGAAIATAAGVGMRLGIRVSLSRLSGAEAPIVSAGTSAEYFIDDAHVATHDSSTNAAGTFPLNIGPGVCMVRSGGSAHAVNIPYWTYTIGPVRSGATTV